MKDPYSVLGLDSSADRKTLQAKYNELHELYAEQRFKSGEEGNEGARKLQELEEAWEAIGAKMSKDSVSSPFYAGYDQIDELIRQGKYNNAQDMLDAISDRNGEWHYLQAIVFYKREWLSDAKTQLEMALRDDPSNAKYRSSLDKLNIAMGAQTPFDTPPQNRQNAGGYNNGQYNGPYNDGGRGPRQQQEDMANCLSTCCCAYCLTDCLCNAMQCF